MTDWLYNLPLGWMTLVVFAATFCFAAAVFFVVTRLAVDDQARAFKSLSPGMLPPLGIIFGLLVGFTAAQVWSDFERAKVAVVSEASALRGVVLLAASFPGEDEARLRALVGRHIEDAISKEWPAMARHRVNLTLPPAALSEALQVTLALSPATDGQRTAQRELANALQNALEARRQRIIISQSPVSTIKWMGLLLQALCTLIAIAMVHSDNRTTCAIAVTLFSTGIALSVLLIAAYNRPFSGDLSVGPDLLMQVDPGGATPPRAQ
jgi:hypothetical protein